MAAVSSTSDCAGDHIDRTRYVRGEEVTDGGHLVRQGDPAHPLRPEPSRPPTPQPDSGRAGPACRPSATKPTKYRYGGRPPGHRRDGVFGGRFPRRTTSARKPSPTGSVSSTSRSPVSPYQPTPEAASRTVRRVGRRRRSIARSWSFRPRRLLSTCACHDASSAVPDAGAGQVEDRVDALDGFGWTTPGVQRTSSGRRGSRRTRLRNVVAVGAQGAHRGRPDQTRRAGHCDLHSARAPVTADLTVRQATAMDGPASPCSTLATAEPGTYVLPPLPGEPFFGARPPPGRAGREVGRRIVGYLKVRPPTSRWRPTPRAPGPGLGGVPRAAAVRRGSRLVGGGPCRGGSTGRPQLSLRVLPAVPARRAYRAAGSGSRACLGRSPRPTTAGTPTTCSWP